ncbi:MAG: ECF transporter S component [Infirmifilum sp.]|uniref:ECF transporter S component n=1 Tax=Infirmifilum TaxID=2856573 RepID=UPI003C751742
MAQQRKWSVFVAIVAVFSALCAAITAIVSVPSPTGYTHIGDTVIYLAALLFGSQVGAAVGLIGPVIADIIVGYPRWYVTLVAHGLQGYIAGFAKGKSFRTKVMLMITAGLVMSFTYFVVNVYVKGLIPALTSLIRDILGQTLVSVVLSALLVRPLENNSVIRKVSQMI